jgi:hypothetical protein
VAGYGVLTVPVASAVGALMASGGVQAEAVKTLRGDEESTNAGIVFADEAGASVRFTVAEPEPPEEVVVA